jgi:hypothetical protein
MKTVPLRGGGRAQLNDRRCHTIYTARNQKKCITSKITVVTSLDKSGKAIQLHQKQLIVTQRWH